SALHASAKPRSVADTPVNANGVSRPLSPLSPLPIHPALSALSAVIPAPVASPGYGAPHGPYLMLNRLLTDALRDSRVGSFLLVTLVPTATPHTPTPDPTPTGSAARNAQPVPPLSITAPTDDALGEV